MNKKGRSKIKIKLSCQKEHQKKTDRAEEQEPTGEEVVVARPEKQEEEEIADNKNIMQNIFKSRNVWSIIIMFLVGGFEAITGSIPGPIFGVIMAILGAAGIYFRVNPKQQFDKAPLDEDNEEEN